MEASAAEDEEPRSVRWPRCLGVAELSTPGLYEALLAQPASDETLTQIEKDLPRTMSHTGLMKPGTPMWESVKRILRAYAAHDSATGYVQSMNFIAAFLLLSGLSEQDAFWCLVSLVSRVVPGYFSEGMSAAKLDARVLRALLHVHLPALALHVDELSAAAGDEHLITSIVAGQWLLTLFVNVLPPAAVSAVWDELARAAHRAPLFAAALSLLAGAQAQVIATAEMGEALELLQGLGARCLLQPDAADAFLERLRGYARGPLSPAALAAACARELGEGGPEAGLGSFLTGGRLAGKGAGAGAGPGAGPGGPPGYAAATDASELLRGLTSGGLYALAHSRGAADAADDDGGGLQAELAAVQCLEGGTPKAAAAAAAAGGLGLQPGGVAASSAPGALGAEDVLRLSDALVRLERSLRDAPWMRAAARDAVRARVLRPLGALAGARLSRARADLAEQADAFAAAVDGVLAARGLSGLDTQRHTYLAMWEHGGGEAALAQAERLLERLGRARNGWRALAHAFAADDAPGTPNGSPVPFGTPGEPGSAAAALTVCEATVQAAAAAHAAKAAAAMTALRAQLARRMAAAAEDLPRLAANEAEVGAFLEARRQTALRGAVEWMTTWDARRAEAADAATDALLASAAAAADALQGGPLPPEAATPGSPPPAPEAPPPPEAPPEAAATLAGYETEAARCGAALAALALAQRNLTRRRERLAREAALVRAVRQRAACRVADAAARAESMHAAAARCAAHLRALAAPTAPAAADAVCARIEELQAAALAVVSSAMCDSAGFLADATTAALMSYVTLIDRCAEDMSALSEQMAVALRMERERESQKMTLPSGREVLSVVGTTISKAVNNAVGAPAIAAAGALAAAAAGGAIGGGSESGDEDAAAGGARGPHRPGARAGPAAGAGFIAGALRRGLAAAARGFEVPRGELEGEDGAAEGAHPRSQPASPQQRRHADGPMPATPGGAASWLLDAPGPPPPEEVAYDAEGRPRRKGRSERALEMEMQALAERRADLLARKEAFTALLRRGAAGAAKRAADEAAPAGAAAPGADAA